MAANIGKILGGLGGPAQGFAQIVEYQVVGQIVGALIAPYLATITEQIWAKDPSLQLSIADAVDAAVKSHMSIEDAIREASLSGVDKGRFTTLLNNAGEPPALDFLTEAFRRGFIPQDSPPGDTVSLAQGIRESRLKNKWVPIVEKMQFHLAPVGTLIEGWLRAQIPEADALRLLAENGVDEATGRLMYKSAGRPPSPQELIELHHRGAIPEAGEGPDVLSLRQGYLETDLKNKWYETWLKLSEYLPPPRTIVTLLRNGSITDAEALTYFQKAGLTEQLAAIYVASAHHERTATTRELTKGDVIALHAEGVFDEAETLSSLEKLGYPPEVAHYEIEAAEFRRVKGLIDQAVTRVRSLYIGHKIDKAVVISTLDTLGIPGKQRDQLLTVWTLERQDNVKILTPAEAGRLAKLGIIGEHEALRLLELDGYSPRDAWLRLADALGAVPASPEPKAT